MEIVISDIPIYKSIILIIMAALFRKKSESSRNNVFRDSVVDRAENEALDVETRKHNLKKEKDRSELWIQSRKYLLIAFLVISALLLYKYVLAPDGGIFNESASFDKNTELESIENKIIIGLDGERDKAELLELVSQLNHTDSDNYIEGKKQGIIASDVNSPDDEFFGTFAEYWTGLREGYKEIISRDITIEAYKEELRLRQTKLENDIN